MSTTSNPPAHDSTVASWACAEDGTHECNGVVPLLAALGGPLDCQCWCHRAKAFTASANALVTDERTK